jgi:hypothetical protein
MSVPQFGRRDAQAAIMPPDIKAYFDFYFSIIWEQLIDGKLP